MDIDRLRKLSGLNEKRPGDRGFTPGVQEPEDRLKKDRGFIPGEPEPGYEPGDRGFIPGAPQVPPMPTPEPDKPTPAPFPYEPYPVPGGPPPEDPDRPMPGPKPDRPKIPSPGGPPVPKPDPRPGIDFPMPTKRPEIDAILYGGYSMDPEARRRQGGGERELPMGKKPSLRDYLKLVRR